VSVTAYGIEPNTKFDFVMFEKQGHKLHVKLDISASKWDLKYGRVSGKGKEAQNLNAKLDSIRMGIEKCHSKIMESDRSVKSDKLKDVFLGMESGELIFFKFYDRFISGQYCQV
jgi:hypothetical protein